MEELGQGVHVITVDDNEGSYVLNMGELEKILLQPEVRDKLVALVSVAGAYRGGKSFLLDFFLRYLSSEEDHRSTGKWLGEDEEPLRGFSWSSGSERHTTGLMLWSKPIPIVLPSGETVMVILMDTQGTFDHQSTIRDCSTIFALSTMLSSVQIYNLKENIKADDLHYLQLFTEYGLMASTENEKSFQTLQFLVRDWPYPHEYAYGISGGEQLLRNRLSVNNTEKKELHEIRQHIWSCFDNINCFLLPHPGLEVCKPNFKGFLKDITKDFKDSLLELAPMIFKPKNLKVKKINEKPITAADLCNYFKVYTKVFNGDILPEPKTIMKATAEAGLLCAMESSRQRYVSKMDFDCDICLPDGELQKLHDTALNDAIDAFTNIKIMGGFTMKDQYLSQLTQELDSRLQQYQLMNQANTQKILTIAKQTYTEEFKSLCEDDHLLCLHPQDLKDLHIKSMENALNIFETHRKSIEGYEDKEKLNLEKDLKKRFKEICAINDLNNNAAVSEARLEYSSSMENFCGSQPCMNILEMESRHQDALSKALEGFVSKRNRQSDYTEDSYKCELDKVISEHFEKLLTLNRNNNMRAVQTALSIYENDMGSICSQFLPCLHPDDLYQEHDGVKDRALNEFYSNRRFGDSDDTEDEHKQHIIQTLERRYEQLRNMNNRNNSLAVEEALSLYCGAMDTLCGAGSTRISAENLMASHERFSGDALRLFQNKRRPYEDSHVDSYREQLTEEIEERLRHYRNLNENNPEPVMEVARRENDILPQILSTVIDSTLIIANVLSMGRAGGILPLMAIMRRNNRQ